MSYKRKKCRFPEIDKSPKFSKIEKECMSYNRKKS